MTKQQSKEPLLIPLREFKEEYRLITNKALDMIDLLALRKVIHRMIYQRRPHRTKNPGKVGRPTVDIAPLALDYVISQHAKGRLSFREAAKVLRVNKATAKDAIENPDKYKKRGA